MKSTLIKKKIKKKEIIEMKRMIEHIHVQEYVK